MMDRRAFVASAVAAAVTPLAGCGSRAPLRVAVHPWIGYETLYIANHFGWLPADVALQQGRQLRDSAEAFEAGVVDAATLTLDEVVRQRSRGTGVEVIAVMDVSSGGDVVMARPPLITMDALKGKRVGLVDDALSYIVLHHALASVGLVLGDVALRPVPHTGLLDAWRAGQFDAIVTYEPMASLLTREGAVRIFDSRQMPDAIFDVLALRRGRVNHRAVFGLLRAHFQGLNHLRVNRQDALYRIAAHQGLSVDETRRVLGGIRLPDLAANHAMLQPGSSLDAAAHELAEFMVQNDLLQRAGSLDGLLNDRYLPDHAA